jgi:hypothetical protein
VPAGYALQRMAAPPTVRALSMASTTNPNGSDPKHRRRRRHSGKPPAPNVTAPAKVVADALKAPQEAAWVEEPLTPQEIAKLKVQFRFLRDNRHLLKLRVNAAEDLLLNGVKEPTHRGVCQHLLAKVERSRVLSVSQTMPPDQAVRLLSGIIRFAPDIAYILRYLECVKQTASQQQSGAALTEALKQIEFTELSAAQMRQLVALIVDVFAERDLPVFLFTLLYDRSFKEALDRSLEGFPEVLGRMVVPLRVLHGLIAHAAPKHSDSGADMQALKAGVALLCDVNPASLAQLPEGARQRLLLLSCEFLRAKAGPRGDTLIQLQASLTFAQDTDRVAAALTLAESLVAAGEEPSARKWLDRELSGAAGGNGNALARFRESLDRPRVGLIAVDAPRSNGKPPPAGRWYRGWHLLLRETVLVRVCRKEEQSALAEQIALWRSLLVPGVSRVVGAAVDAQTGYLAVELPGQPLFREGKRANRIEELTRLRWAVQICALLEGLSNAGVVLEDAKSNRFNVDPQGHLWLVDLWPLQGADAQRAHAENLEHARAACRELLNQAPCYSLADDALQQLEAAGSLKQLASIF